MKLNQTKLKIRQQIEKLSNSESRIFIYGPTGSGKELIARKIHKLSKRNKYPFVVLNGALLDVKKYELELFGEEKEDGSISMIFLMLNFHEENIDNLPYRFVLSFAKILSATSF